jgi:hypothetical protein
VYVPNGFDPTPPIALIVYIHGFHNCVDNIVRDTGQPCTAGGPARGAYALITQLEASHKNALLLAPEVAFDQATSDPGTLGQPGGFRALVSEALADLAPALGPLTVDDLGTVVVATHSGGYAAAAGIAARGGVPVDELYLLDSLYGNVADYDAWVKGDLPSLHPPFTRRLADIYTSGGGTLANSQAMATRAAGWVGADGGTLVDDQASAEVPDATFAHGLVFKLTAHIHDDVPRIYFRPLLSTSTLPDKVP